MQPLDTKQALIVSQRTIASHQVAVLLHKHGWQTTIMNNRPTLTLIEHLNPSLLVVDIDDAALHGITLLQYFRQSNPVAYAVAISAGGGSPAMKLTRQLGLDGFFYLNPFGMALDTNRGLTPFLRESDDNLVRLEEARQWRTPKMDIPHAAGY